ncbi:MULTISPECIES: ABC transporter ATP-binding protein [unclassified Aureispira]|uniref:ABC transporter ATP-binding protein n=1 Tax=unclassified Aureispira TaxID=2649989 RepID=UPI000696D342|nr:MULTISPECIES: ABC transporter ATP-binding protein [unclassified Aureispira]WMX14611.1 ABC transporter ATP-binding protein [Aureispira sp. CCB-E]
MSFNCIQIEEVSKRYKGAAKDSLKKVSLTIQTGDVYGILGPNGAGKTTLISILCGIIEASGGHVLYRDNNEEVNFQGIQPKIGFVPQEYALYQELTPVQNLEYFGALYNLSKEKIAARTTEILDVLGLSRVAHQRVETFSGGMKRRVNLAIGIIHEPSILFLDEPTVGVDVQSKVAILKFLNHLNAMGTTIIYTSHHLSEAQDFCNRIALIDQGEIIMKGEMETLLSTHAAKDLKSLFIQFTGEEYRD